MRVFYLYLWICFFAFQNAWSQEAKKDTPKPEIPSASSTTSIDDDAFTLKQNHVYLKIGFLSQNYHETYNGAPSGYYQNTFMFEWGFHKPIFSRLHWRNAFLTNLPKFKTNSEEARVRFFDLSTGVAFALVNRPQFYLAALGGVQMHMLFVKPAILGHGPIVYPQIGLEVAYEWKPGWMTGLKGIYAPIGSGASMFSLTEREWTLALRQDWKHLEANTLFVVMSYTTLDYSLNSVDKVKQGILKLNVGYGW